MKIFFWLLSICLNFALLFIITKRYERPFLIKAFIAVIPIAIVGAVLVALIIGKVLRLQTDYHFTQNFFSGFFTIIVISMINFANQVFHFMVDTVVEFHQKNNAANLNRQPIKFFVKNQNALKYAATIIWFLGSALMLYGVWFDQPK